MEKNPILNHPQGAEKVKSYVSIILMAIIISIGFVLFKFLGILAGFALIGLPIGLLVLSVLWKRPQLGVWATIAISFFAAGIARYVSGPWGLSVDILLALSWVIVILNKEIKVNWKFAKNDLVLVTTLWFGFIVVEMINPAGNGPIAWFYAMRSIGFYQALTIPMVFLFFREEKDLQKFINTIIWFSLIGTVWGFKQQLLGVDAAEHHWLYAENHAEQHILHGVLRVFSFYSDAGAFGASQAMMSLMCAILFMGPFKMTKKFQYLIFAFIFLLGFAISGTRGALAVPFGGGIAYLILSKNFKVLAGGASAMIIVFVILKYTFLFQGVEQVRRMRSALDPENASMNVRLDNQKIFARYLADKPFGGGVGTAGYWGARFNPNSLMANTATDSWYTKIWAETGLLGFIFHMMIVGYILGKAGHKIMCMRNEKNRTYAIAMYAMFAGALLASYGNQVLIHMPTAIILNFALPFIFLIDERDKEEQLQLKKVENQLID